MMRLEEDLVSPLEALHRLVELVVQYPWSQDMGELVQAVLLASEAHRPEQTESVGLSTFRRVQQRKALRVTS